MAKSSVIDTFPQRFNSHHSESMNHRMGLLDIVFDVFFVAESILGAEIICES